jgi:hypothetical protein
MFFLVVPFVFWNIWVKRKEEIPRRDIYQVFVIWTISLAASRLATVASFYWPIYRFYLVVHWICALFTVLVAYKLWYGKKDLLAIPSADAMRVLTDSLRNEIVIREQTQQELEQQNRNLIIVISHLKYMVETEMWLHDKNKTINELNAVLKVLGDDI